MTMILELNGKELFDLLSLSNRFIEIGMEYSGDEETQLLVFMAEDVTAKYVNEFKSH